MSHDNDNDDYNVHAHIASMKANTAILLCLLTLTALTVLAYNVRLGDLNLGVALLIASLKATLVMAFFMHLAFDKAFNIAFFVGSIIFMGIFFGYTANDTEHRGAIDNRYAMPVDPRTGEFAGGTPREVVEQGGYVVPLTPPAAPEGEGEHH